MQQYKIRPNGFKEIKKQMLIRSVPITLIAITVGVSISIINAKDKAALVNILPIIIPLVTVAIGYGTYSGVKQLKRIFESYQLTLTNNLITREQFNTPTVSIYFNDIKEIIKNKSGSFSIKGKDPTDLIVIPVQIENYSSLEATLNQIKPFASRSGNPFFQKYSIVIIILTMALMLCVFTVTNKVIVVLSGTILSAILLWSFYETRKSKNIDAKTKRSMWWIFIVLASIIGVVIMKLISSPKA